MRDGSGGKVHVAGLTMNPDEIWMKQIARNLTMADGLLKHYYRAAG